MLPPGPWTPAFWQTLQFVRDPDGYSTRMMARYGSTTRFRALNGNGVATADPEIARKVFATDPALFETPDTLPGVFGEHSVLATWGPTHKRQRKLLNPRFHGQEIRALAVTMDRVVREHQSWFEAATRSGTPLVMADYAQRLTLDVILATVFGSSTIDPEEGRAILQNATRMMPPAAIFSRVLRTNLFPPWRRYLEARATFDGWIDRILRERRGAAAATEGVDLLGMLLAARYEDGNAMADAEIRDLIFALLIAGHETTAVALAWAVYFLLREPNVSERLRVELAANKGAPESIIRLPYLEAVIKETLRIEPIVSDVARICREPLALGAWTVPAGEIVAVNIAALSQRSDLFPEPKRFMPDRFLERSFHPGEYVPFGGGHRRCLGAAFAEAELALALATIVGDWDLALADAAPERSVRRNITMGPERGVRVKVIRRRPEA
jgi:cytochrome P450 family 110